MAFKEIEYWASIINDNIADLAKYENTCKQSIKNAKLYESKSIEMVDEDSIEPDDLGFYEECDTGYDSSVFEEAADPLKEKFDVDLYVEKEEELDECDDDYSTICIKFDDSDEDELAKYLEDLFSRFIDIDCENMSDNLTNSPVYRLIGPLSLLKQLFTSSRCTCNDYNDLPVECKQKFEKHLNTTEPMNECDFFGFGENGEPVNPSTANIADDHTVEMSIVAEGKAGKKTSKPKTASKDDKKKHQQKTLMPAFKS